LDAAGMLLFILMMTIGIYIFSRGEYISKKLVRYFPIYYLAVIILYQRDKEVQVVQMVTHLFGVFFRQNTE